MNFLTDFAELCKTYFDTSMVTNLNILYEFTPCYDDTSTFVSTHQWELCWQGPVTVDSVEISVANARVLDVDENFIWAGLCNWDLLVDDSYDELEPLRSLKPGIDETYVLRFSRQLVPIVQLEFVVTTL
jgi:hypothetical protein